MSRSKIIVIPALRLRSRQARIGICLCLLTILYGGLANAQTKMTPSEADALKINVKTLADATRTITSDFVQYQHIEFITEDIESSGTMAFKSPNMVKWAYEKPDVYSYIFKNEKLYINNNGHKSDMDMGSNQVFKQLNQLITASIKGDMFDEEEFTISYFKKNSDSEVHFIPADEQFSEFIKAIHITFGVQGEVKEVKMVEPSEDYTKIVFKNRIANQPLSDAVFVQ